MLWIKLDLPSKEVYIDISKLYNITVMHTKSELWLHFLGEPNPMIITSHGGFKKILNQILGAIDEYNMHNRKPTISNVVEVNYSDN